MDAATAGQIILSDPRARRLAARAAAIAAAVVATPLVLLLALVVAISSPSSPGTVGSADGIPAVYAPMYEAAASYYHVNPYVLAALHETESDYSRDPSAFTPNSAGAIGPMQFLPATWAGFANAYRPIADERPSSYPHECAPHGCITDDYDSIAAAADYLHELGADAGLDQRTLDALISYKGTPPASVPYARETFTLAQQLARRQRDLGGHGGAGAVGAACGAARDGRGRDRRRAAFPTATAAATSLRRVQPTGPTATTPQTNSSPAPRMTGSTARAPSRCCSRCPA